MTVKKYGKTGISNCHKIELSQRFNDSSKVRKNNHFQLSQLSPPKGGTPFPVTVEKGSPKAGDFAIETTAPGRGKTIPLCRAEKEVRR